MVLIIDLLFKRKFTMKTLQINLKYISGFEKNCNYSINFS